MECGVEVRGGSATATGMLNVGSGVEAAAAGGGAGTPNSATGLPPAPYAPPDVDQAQFEADKRAVYKHPLFPLLALLFERCELATQSSDSQSSDAFNMDIQAFVQHQERDRKPFLANEPEIDGLMIKAIQVLRIHLLELEKVQELCKDFCNRYITCLKGKMQSENLLRSDYAQAPGVMSSIENNNNMLSHGNSESSDSNSPVQYSISPTQQGGMVTGGSSDCGILEQRGAGHQPGLLATDQNPVLNSAINPQSQLRLNPQTTPTPQETSPLSYHQQYPSNTNGGPAHHYNPENTPPAPVHVVHGSTPLGQIGVSVCPPLAVTAPSGVELSPCPTTPGTGSADDCDSSGDMPRSGSKKQKRGVLPKHATSVMRSWLFQHLVHPYPTEDEKRHIAAQTNLTLLQVNNWFINARRRILQPMLDAGGGTGGSTNGDQATPPGSKLPGSGHSRKRPHHSSSSKRFWPQELQQMGQGLTMAGLQAATDGLSSSDDECSSYSSDGEDGSLVIDSGADRNGAPLSGTPDTPSIPTYPPTPSTESPPEQQVQ